MSKSVLKSMAISAAKRNAFQEAFVKSVAAMIVFMMNGIMPQVAHEKARSF
jgi:hypothetical protein